ncbi:hypothetical protein AB0I53_08005 [Saccharopolyspora sp. NPDC050389]|uniref:aromatic-ring hydroxylase C-terminal domain-containing protein n=1 Tax=Saccharopolyspora sp. NPDC050389 TaxID=3155516 RepID=UPI0033EE9078
MGAAAGLHPLIGRCAPELALHTETGPVRLAELTRSARPLLIDLTEDGSPGTLAGHHDQADVIRGRLDGADIGATALLLRPDCYVAWASASLCPDATELDALQTAAERWFGVAATARA